MIKLYTDNTFLTEANRAFVFPLLFDLVYVKNEFLNQYYSIVDNIEECNIVVFPVDYNIFCRKTKPLNMLCLKAKTNSKPIWLYTAGDFGFTVYIPNSYNFRLGGFDSKLNKNTFILPSFVNDPYKTVLKQSFSVMPKTELPVIGFVGHANTGILNYIKSYLSYLKLRLKRIFKRRFFDLQKFYPSSSIRGKVLNKLKRSKRIETNFILRKKYRAGAVSQQQKEKTTQDFYNNIYNNIYTFCMRGVGNFSVRFYETLAVGRIPVLLNTDCRLPLTNYIDWKKHTVIIDASSKVSIASQIADFHNSKSDDEIKAMQQNNRLLWETQLMRHSYFKTIHDLFLNKIEDNA